MIVFPNSQYHYTTKTYLSRTLSVLLHARLMFWCINVPMIYSVISEKGQNLSSVHRIKVHHASLNFYSFFHCFIELKVCFRFWNWFLNSQKFEFDWWYGSLCSNFVINYLFMCYNMFFPYDALSEVIYSSLWLIRTAFVVCLCRR